MLVVTTNDLPGYRVVKSIGVVRGLTVRSRSVVGNIGAAIQTFFGGTITVYTKLAEQTREEAYDLMVKHAHEMGANAIVGMRYDANEIASAVTEVSGLRHGGCRRRGALKGRISGDLRLDGRPWAKRRLGRIMSCQLHL